MIIKYIRHILKQSGLLQADHGGLNSFAIILLVIAFCQKQEEPILPNLHEGVNGEEIVFHSCTRNKWGKNSVQQVKYSFNEDLQKVKEEFAFTNTKSVSQLVIEFLRDFFLNDDIIKTHQIDIRKGGYIEEETDEYSYIDIVEPFTEGARVGKGCRKDSYYPQTYTRFAFEFLSNVIGCI